jgi:hypothetical protein
MITVQEFIEIAQTFANSFPKATDAEFLRFLMEFSDLKEPEIVSLLEQVQLIQQLEQCAIALPNLRLPESVPVAQPPAIDFYNWVLPEEATGLAIFGDPGSGKTCTAIQMLGLLTQVLGPAQIIVMDLHDQPGKWGNLTVVDEILAIIQVMQWFLLTDLPQRRKDLKRNKQHPLTIWVLEELGGVTRSVKRLAATIDNKEERKLLENLVSDFLVELGSQGRKYEYLGVLVNQAGNIGANGMSGFGDYLEAYHQIWLGRVATKRAKLKGCSSNSLTFLNSQPYPCLVGG